MGNIYSAQNIAAYFIYEINEKGAFVNPFSIQHLLAVVDNLWHKTFGHTAFKEETATFSESNYFVKEVFEAYKEFEDQHIALPAKEWHLEYGQFQLVHRTYAVPAFSTKEMLIVNSVLNKYLKITLHKAS